MALKIKAKELGFGTLAAKNGQRFMNADGTANVERRGGPWMSVSDLFHKLTTMKWRKFASIILVAYVLANLLFASIFYKIGIQHIGVEPTGKFSTDFTEAFFFSTQCFTTIGFGRVNPQNFAANSVASIEGLIGLLSLAIATGLLYGRFSRPVAQLVHSNNILIAPYRGDQKALMFRIASTRKQSLLIENSVSVSMGINIEEHGQLRRRFFVLELELDKINFLNLSWTIVHPITEGSPLWGRSIEELIQGRAEFIILFKAMEETTSQVVIDRFSYFTEEIIWGANFISAIGTREDGKPVMDLNKIGLYEMVELPKAIGETEASIIEQVSSAAGA